jgi:hypothetical protein
MTVQELRAELIKLPQTDTVMLSCDPEGNNYSDIGRLALETNPTKGNVVSIYPND